MAPGHLPYQFPMPEQCYFSHFYGDDQRSPEAPGHLPYSTCLHVALPNSVLTVMFMEPQVCQPTCRTHYKHPMWSTITKASMDVLECQAICLPRHKCMDSRTPIQVPLNPQLYLALLQMTFMLVPQIPWPGLPVLAWPALCHHGQPGGGGSKRKLQTMTVRLAGKTTMCSFN